MNALKYLPVIATLMLSPTLHAAEVFVSHYEPLHNMTTHAVDSTSANGSQKLQREAPAVLSFEALGTGLVRWKSMVSIGEAPLKGSCPVIISKRITPRDQISDL